MLAFSIDYYGIFFGATQSVELFCTYDKVPFQEKDPEKVRQANEFAAALLMPRYIFFLTLEAASDIAESGKRTIHMQAVADFFNVSLSAAYTRAKIFGII